MFRLAGGEWVSREIVNQVKAGRARFVISSGDVVWWGNQGRRVDNSPYWERLNEIMLKQLPDPDSELRAAGWRVGGSSAAAITRSGAIPKSKEHSPPCHI